MVSPCAPSFTHHAFKRVGGLRGGATPLRPRTDAHARSGERLKRERLRLVANEPVGPYTLLRLERGVLDPGIPGQFFMLEPPGRLLPRPM